MNASQNNEVESYRQKYVPAHFTAKAFKIYQVPGFLWLSFADKKAISSLQTMIKHIQQERLSHPERLENPLPLIEWLDTHYGDLPVKVQEYVFDRLQFYHLMFSKGWFGLRDDEVVGYQSESKMRGVNEGLLFLSRMTVRHVLGRHSGKENVEGLDADINTLYHSFKKQELLTHPVYGRSIDKMIHTIENLTALFDRACFLCVQKKSVEPLTNFFHTDLRLSLKERDFFLYKHPELKIYQPLYDATPIELFAIHADWAFFKDRMNALPTALREQIPSAISLACDIQAAVFCKTAQHYSSFGLNQIIPHYEGPQMNAQGDAITLKVGGYGLQDTGTGEKQDKMLITKFAQQSFFIPQKDRADILQILSMDKWQKEVVQQAPVPQNTTHHDGILKRTWDCVMSNFKSRA